MMNITRAGRGGPRKAVRLCGEKEEQTQRYETSPIAKRSGDGEWSAVCSDVAEEEGFEDFVSCRSAPGRDPAPGRGVSLLRRSLACRSLLWRVCSRHLSRHTRGPLHGGLGYGGGRGIRTHECFRINSFQDCRNQPLCHSSASARKV